MKKIILLAVAALGIQAAQAQVTLTGSKLTDNVSFTLKGGAIAPFQHYSVFKNARGVFGAELRKQVTPILGIGVEGEWTINTSSWGKAPANVWQSALGVKSKNIIDHQFVGAFSALNLSNLFGGYKGAPRCVEVEAVLGAGWLHAYQAGADVTDENSWYTKYGVNFNFNLGESKAWTISLKPSILWDMNADAKKANRKENGGLNACESRYNANAAAIELQAGITYHFQNSNGARYFTLCDKKYTQADVDALNGQINSLRNQVNNAQADLDACNARAAQLARDLEACKAQKNKVTEVVKVQETEVKSASLETNVFFHVGKSTIDRAQQPNVERVATFLKNHPEATVSIKGYASPEGPQDLNIRLANARANAVKDMLVKTYKVKADRIQAEGQGIGDMFSEPDWNRVSICYINTNEK
ncbi:MAG: OmpA family protein [Bacteroidales bacterium]|nr:OmpA family protein [Bacteroidales bacterium]